MGIFQTNLKQLGQIYLISGGINFYYDGDPLVATIKRNSEFWDKYSKHLSTKDIFNDKNLYSVLKNKVYVIIVIFYREFQ